MSARFLAIELRRIARNHSHSVWWAGEDGVQYLVDIRFLAWTIARVSDEDDPAAVGGTTRVAEIYATRGYPAKPGQRGLRLARPGRRHDAHSGALAAAR